MAQRTPSNPTLRLRSLSEVCGSALFNSGTASLHLPESAKCRARVTGDDKSDVAGRLEPWATDCGTESTKGNSKIWTRKGYLRIKIRQASKTPALIIHRSVIEFQSELDVPWRLRTGKDSHPRTHSRCATIRIQIHAIESIEEVGAELHLHSLTEGKVLLQAQVHIRVSRSTYRSLCRAVSKALSIRRQGIRRRIEPLIADVSSGAGIERCFPPEDAPCAGSAIRTRPARAGVGRIVGEVVQSQGEASVARDNRSDGPSTGNLIDHAIHVVAEPLAVTEWYLVYRIGAEYVLGIEIAWRIVSSWIVEVLIIRIRGNSLRTSPGAVVAAVVRHALGERVCDLVLQSAAIAFLEDRLKGVIFHLPNGSRTRDLRYIFLESRISREENARRGAGLRDRGGAHHARSAL